MSIQLRVKASMRLLAYLRAYCPSYSSVKALKRAIDHKRCKINGRVERFSTHQVNQGDVIEIALGPIEKQESPLVLGEEEQYVAYNKPPYVLSQPPQKDLFSVHRLDKETSGVLLFAKTLEAQEQIGQLFKDRRVEKTYLAVVDGRIEKKQWTCDNFLGKKESYEGGAIYGPVSPRIGKRAVTHFWCLKTTEKASLLLCQPITGRTHQIRSHLKTAKHPILGDWQYGRQFTSSYEPKRHLLHAYSLFIYNKRIIAPLFEDFRAACADLFKLKKPTLADLLHG